MRSRNSGTKIVQDVNLRNDVHFELTDGDITEIVTIIREKIVQNQFTFVHDGEITPPCAIALK
jgi:hypothetical protein